MFSNYFIRTICYMIWNEWWEYLDFGVRDINFCFVFFFFFFSFLTLKQKIEFYLEKNEIEKKICIFVSKMGCDWCEIDVRVSMVAWLFFSRANEINIGRECSLFSFFLFRNLLSIHLKDFFLFLDRTFK